MRHFVVLYGLIALLSAHPSSAFEVEDRVMFGPDDADQVIRVISTGDADLFAPIIEDFLLSAPDISIDYIVASSAELKEAVAAEAADIDVAISSAMDLQTKLVNDGFAQAHRSAATNALPDWAKWRDHLFAFTNEPAAIVLSRSALHGLPEPRSRQDIIDLMRTHPDRFSGKVGTYDVRVSGLGYLFATQDSRASETYWRLTEVMGSLGVRLYCCSGQMIDDVANGDLAVAYNALGSYARAHPKADDLFILLPDDFTTVMLRTAFVARTSQSPDLAGRFVDHLVSRNWTSAPGLSEVFDTDGMIRDDQALRRIRMGPGLLVFLDAFKKRAFFEEWSSAVLQ